MVDIGADLALTVTEAFQKLYEDGDVTIKVLTKRLEGNKAKLDDAHRYSMRVGELLAQVYRDEISSEVLPDGRMYWNIANKVIKEPLENNYRLAVEASMKAIEAQNKAKGIGLKVVRPKLAADRIEGLVNKVSDADKYDDAAFALDRPVVTFTAKACDDVVQTNADFQAEAGLSVKVVRTPRGAHTCDWCKSVAGSYDYSKVKNGHDVWRRHADCDCLIEFVSSKGREVVRNYRKGSRRLDERGIIEERRALPGIKARSNFAKAVDALKVDAWIDDMNFKLEDVVTELKKSPIGLQVMKELEDGKLDVRITEGYSREGIRGELKRNGTICLYQNNISSAKLVAQTLIHERTHFIYNIGYCQHAEAICFAMEKMHLIGRDWLTEDEWNAMKRLAIDNYQEFKWESGGYGDFNQFNFVKRGV